MKKWTALFLALLTLLSAAALAEQAEQEERPAVMAAALLAHLVDAYERPSQEGLARIDADVEVLGDPVAASVAAHWKQVYLDPAYPLLLYGTDDPALLNIPDCGRDHAFVVLGYELADGEMTEELKGRCRAAAAAAQAFPDAILVCSGGATGDNNPEKHTEAGLMKEFLAGECGIAADRIFTDELALTTAENARNTFVILQSEGARSMTIVTSSYHQRWGQALYNAVGAQYAQDCGYCPAILGNYCFDIAPSVALFEKDDLIAASQLAQIMGLPANQIAALTISLQKYWITVSLPPLGEDGPKGSE